MQGEQRRFQRRAIVSGIACPTNARAADFHGNGKLAKFQPGLKFED